MTQICVSKLTIIGSDNGLSPGRRQAIIWTNDGILLIRTLGTNFSEILGKIHSFSLKKMHLKMSSAKERLFTLGLNVLTPYRYLPTFSPAATNGQSQSKDVLPGTGIPIIKIVYSQSHGCFIITIGIPVSIPVYTETDWEKNMLKQGWYCTICSCSI